MARLIRLSEAIAAMSSLDEALENARRSEVERDSAILRLIYTHEAVWKACQQLLRDKEDLDEPSPNRAIRAARRLGWLTDEEAEAALKIGQDRNLAVHMYRGQIADEIEQRLATHAAVLRRWLHALNDAAGETMPSHSYHLFRQAMIERKQIVCSYEGHRRELCPIILGHSSGEERALTFQFAGESRSGLPPGGEWRCLWLFKVADIQLRDGAWHVGASHKRPQGCVDVVDLDVNPASPYRQGRRL
ncbi:MAG: nucleotidyltransferase substrate binding protein [Alphaproteobacteria bacterium]|nr:nucleotidyltransferase substrate binding protein [Alphaproteobacteria bacterium]